MKEPVRNHLHNLARDKENRNVYEQEKMVKE